MNEHQSREISKVSRRRALKTTKNEHEVDRLAPEKIYQGKVKMTGRIDLWSVGRDGESQVGQGNKNNCHNKTYHLVIV